MKKNFLINLFYQKKLPIYLIAFSFLFITLTFNKTVLAQVVTYKSCSTANNICEFGDEWAETDNTFGGELKQISCLNGGGVKDLSWINNKRFFCVGAGIRQTKFENDNYLNTLNNGYIYKGLDAQTPVDPSSYEGWVECDKSYGSGGYSPTDITLVSQLVIRDYTPSDNLNPSSLKYFFTGTNRGLKPGCVKCNAKNIVNCPSYIPQPVNPTVDCNITTTDSCTFGSTTSTTNCAKVTNTSLNRKVQGGKTYFCNSDNKTVVCDTALTTVSYDSMFVQVMSGGTREYKDIETNYRLSPNNCKLLSTVNTNSNCQLKSTSISDSTCTFGPKASSNSSTFKNCATLETGEGSTTINSKYVYCAPDNKKIQCDQQITYNEMFGPSQNASGEKDYTGKSSSTLTSSALSKGCKLYSTPTGCNVTSSATPGADCFVPKSCFETNKLVTIKINNDFYGLYCISKSNRNSFEGNLYVCPVSSGGSPYDYSSIANIDNSNGYVSFSNSPITHKGNSVTPASLCERYTDSFISAKYRELNPLSPLGLIRSASTFLYYFAIFYFIILMLTNAFAYVRSGEDPAALKKIKESLFNTIAGFLFVLLSGGVIVYLINQFTP
jgi:hypothetical protein